MALSDDLKHIIVILEEEGFGAIAGELMTEISLGRPIEKKKEDLDDARSVNLETTIFRVQIEQSDQVMEAMDFLRQRLVAPVRAFAEAERIAGDIFGDKALRIRFIDPDERVEAVPISRTDPGDASVADRLEALLAQLPSTVMPPLTDGS